MSSAPSVYSMMFNPCGAEYLSLCIQSFSFWSLSFRALSLFLGREMNSSTCILKSEVPLCISYNGEWGLWPPQGDHNYMLPGRSVCCHIYICNIFYSEINLKIHIICVFCTIEHLLVYSSKLNAVFLLYPFTSSCIVYFISHIQGAYFAWKATAMGKNFINGRTFLEKR